MSGYKKKGPAKKPAKPRTRPYLHKLRDVDPYADLIAEREATAHPGGSTTPPPSPEVLAPRNTPTPSGEATAPTSTEGHPLASLVDEVLAYETITTAAHLAYAEEADARLHAYLSRPDTESRDRARRHLQRAGSDHRSSTGQRLGFPARQAGLIDRALVRHRVAVTTE